MTPEITLTDCVIKMRTYLRKIDSNGLCLFDDEISKANDSEDLMELLIQTLLSRFQVDIVENSGCSHDPLYIDNLEDRENAITDTLHRCQSWGKEWFAEYFPKAFEYSLFNIHPENDDDDDDRQDSRKA